MGTQNYLQQLRYKIKNMGCVRLSMVIVRLKKKSVTFFKFTVRIGLLYPQRHTSWLPSTFFSLALFRESQVIAFCKFKITENLPIDSSVHPIYTSY